MRRAPTATKFSETPGVKTVWRVEWPSTMRVWGKSYYATTYPQSDLIYLETAAKRRQVSPIVARRILEQVREAIAKAQQ